MLYQIISKEIGQPIVNVNGVYPGQPIVNVNGVYPGQPIVNVNGVYPGKFVLFLDKNSTHLKGFDLIPEIIQSNIC